MEILQVIFWHILKQIIQTIVMFLCKERYFPVSVSQKNMYKIRNL